MAEAGGVLGGGGVEDDEGFAGVGLGLDQTDDKRVGDLFGPSDGRCAPPRHRLQIVAETWKNCVCIFIYI